MKTLVFTFLSLSLAFAADKQLTFPQGFKFGVATSAYQVEGAWNENGKGKNIWDTETHSPNSIVTDKSNGDIACDSYHKTSSDVQLLKNTGVHFYRFSISWSRILPSGFANATNPDGIRYYNDLIDQLLKNGIQPMVTIFHWDLPQPIQDLGGWTNEEIVTYILDYAKVLFTHFGDRVKYWITINEPQVLCIGAYEVDVIKLAPAIVSRGIGTYLCGHNLLRAHAKIYRYYQRYFKKTQKGKLGVANQSFWYEPNSTKAEDVAAADRALEFQLGWFTHPVFSSEGDYPKVMKQRIAQLSKEQHFPRSRLPTFTKYEKRLLRGSADFFGFNHYTSMVCTPGSGFEQPSYEADRGTNCFANSSWEVSSADWLRVVPWGFKKALNWIRTHYKNPEIIVTENGFPDNGQLDDCRRINYLNSYLEALLEAINDGCNITGYAYWSFIDNFEWSSGYTQKFGLYHVDFNSPNRTRTPKMSSYTFANIIKNNKIDWNYQPNGFNKCVFN